MFCECCGRKIEEIQKELSNVPYIDGKREVSVHFQYEDRPKDIYDDNTLRNCCDCGAELVEEDIKYISEFMGYYGSSRACQNIIIGYKCSKCGNVQEF